MNDDFNNYAVVATLICKKKKSKSHPDPVTDKHVKCSNKHSDIQNMGLNTNQYK